MKCVSIFDNRILICAYDGVRYVIILISPIKKNSVVVLNPMCHILLNVCWTSSALQPSYMVRHRRLSWITVRVALTSEYRFRKSMHQVYCVLVFFNVLHLMELDHTLKAQKILSAGVWTDTLALNNAEGIKSKWVDSLSCGTVWVRVFISLVNSWDATLHCCTHFLVSVLPCSRVELKRLCEIFTRMFADPHSKVTMIYIHWSPATHYDFSVKAWCPKFSNIWWCDWPEC